MSFCKTFRIRCLLATRGLVLGLGLFGIVILSLFSAQAQAQQSLLETPSLLPLVEAGQLPAIAKRIPEQPQIALIQGEQRPGRHGGQMRMLMGKQKDIRQIVVYSYARLVGYNSQLELVPDLLRDIEVQDNRIFTLHLRKGHKWSDGYPFSSEDFRYYWEDIANNPELSGGGPPQAMLVDGEPPKVDYLDQHTVRYTWSKPNPFFLPALAAARPLYIYKPAHYLRQFHKKYQSSERIDALIEKYSARNWMGVHVNRDRPYKATNPRPAFFATVGQQYLPACRALYF